MRALTKANEQLWWCQDDDTVVALMTEPMTNEVLRHLGDVRPPAFGPTALLTEVLRMAPVIRILPPNAAAHELGPITGRVHRRPGARRSRELTRD
jgi:hypothetical protein